ncbi:MAG TPA: VOC family protein [Chthoniobacterales bacterium]|nr:VOC family protein [Chthoniobacterales bacterium]
MECVTDIGGIFFKANEPDKLCGWYRKHLGIEIKERAATFKWRTFEDPKAERYTVWLAFPEETDYFAPSSKPLVINFQVANLEELLAHIKKEGVDVDTRVETYDYGKFAWIIDPEGNRIELWEPTTKR